MDLQVKGPGLRTSTGRLASSLVTWPCALPPPDEQAAIVRFLDHADRRIQRYIGAKQRLIGLLEEQKQAVIQRAVTRGLDPDVRLKPSGVEWLGDVPEHWEVRRSQKRVSVVIGRLGHSVSHTLLDTSTLVRSVANLKP